MTSHTDTMVMVGGTTNFGGTGLEEGMNTMVINTSDAGDYPSMDGTMQRVATSDMKKNTEEPAFMKVCCFL